MFWLTLSEISIHSHADPAVRASFEAKHVWSEAVELIVACEWVATRKWGSSQEPDLPKGIPPATTSSKQAPAPRGFTSQLYHQVTSTTDPLMDDV